MAELKNSQRVTYKATYNQISPTATVRGTTDAAGSAKGVPLRAFDKAVFVQSLRIVADELPILKKGMSRGTAAQAAYAAVEGLVDDPTASSTLNNAAAFAQVDPQALVAIATALAAHRKTVADAVTGAVAGVVAAYRDSFASAATIRPRRRRRGRPPRAVPPQVRVSPRSAFRSSRQPLPRALRSRATAGTESRAAKVTISIDETKPSPSAYSPRLGAEALATYTPSNADALEWAYREQPKLFTGLVSQLQPYLGLSPDERVAVGEPAAVLSALRNVFAVYLDQGALQGATAGFESRMTVEPIGNLHLERIEMYPAGVEQGELVHSVPLAPGETVNISHKEWSVTEREFEDIVDDYFEGYSEQGVAEKTDISMSTDSQSQHATALNLGASLSASYASVTLSTNFGYNATTNDSRSKKDSRDHSMELTKKAAARTKKDHKITFKVTSVTGSEDESVRVISNPSATDAMRIDYFQLARKWKVDLLRYGLRMTYDIVIPNPGSGIVTLVEDVRELDALISTPFTFALPLSAITYNAQATDPHLISNYDQLASQYDAAVTAPPEVQKWVNVHKETVPVSDDDYGNVHFDSLEVDIDDDYYVYSVQAEYTASTRQGEPHWVFSMIGGESIDAGAANLIGKSGNLSLDFMYQNIYNVALNITFACRPKVQVLLDWRLEVWNQIRQAAEEQYNKSLQTYQDRRAELVQQIADYDALTLRRMEQEEIMKGVLRWLFGPEFELVPFDLASLFGSDTSDPDAQDVLDPNRLTDAEWLAVMGFGEFIKFLHEAIELGERPLLRLPVFWDHSPGNQALKLFLEGEERPNTEQFLRGGAARVVLTVRPGFEESFTTLIESGAFEGLPGSHPYVTIAQEIQDFANTNYPGFPPANPEQDARPQLYLEQRRVWREMQYVIQLLNAHKAATGEFPSDGGTQKVPAAALDPYLDGPIVVNGTTYNGVNDYNTQANNQQLALDPTTPEDALLPTYTAVPVDDLVWGNPYFYQCPGVTGDYDLISYGADGQPGGTDKDADISANCEASLTSTWYEYTPINALDIGVTMNPPNAVPPQPSSEIA